MSNKYNKKVLLVLRILLFIFGFAVGVLAIWQVFSSKPDLVKSGLQIVFYAVCGFVPAALLLLSAKPVYLLMRTFGTKITSSLNDIKGEDAAGVVLCAVVGIIAGYLCDLLLSLIISVLALRIVLDFFVGLAVLYLCAILFFKLIASEPQPEELEADFERPKEYRGYFITSKAFSCDKLIWLIENWLTGSIYFSSSAFEIFDDNITNKIHELNNSGRLTLVINDEVETENLRIISIAASRALKIIVSDESEAEEFDNTNAPVLIASQL